MPCHLFHLRGWLWGGSILMAIFSLFPGRAGATELDLSAVPQDQRTVVVEGVDPVAESFSVSVSVDPVVAEEGDNQVVVGFAFGAKGEGIDFGNRENVLISLDIREGGGRASWGLWNKGKSLTFDLPDPEPAGWVDTKEYQHPNVRISKPGEGRFRFLRCRR